ncbi:MAG: NTP transferase domain-containing protein, partial [Xanthomonadales bacterium]|nr:NTP transferase domain-containing protein [Xanthomonadales bacterium]
MNAPLHVIVLAAGEGKRMRSTTAKVLLPLAGRPLLAHVLEAARALAPQTIHVVYGHRGELVRAAFAADEDLAWVEQAEQLGTGHAVKLALGEIPDAARVLVLYGDVPLVRAESLHTLVDADAALAVLAAELDDPSGYGRIVLDAQRCVSAIVEQKDASKTQRAIRLTNTGMLAADAACLRGWLAAVGNSNAQGEYYLTDIFAMAAAAATPAVCNLLHDAHKAAGANDAWQLAQLEALL